MIIIIQNIEKIKIRPLSGIIYQGGINMSWYEEKSKDDNEPNDITNGNEKNEEKTVDSSV